MDIVQAQPPLVQAQPPLVQAQPPLVQTGICPSTTKRLHKVLRPGYQLELGTTCHDGRPITESWKYKEAKRRGISILRKKPTVGAPMKEKQELLVDKYAPTSIADIIGHKDVIKQITDWLSSWSYKKPGLLITGPPGIGKTSMIHCIAQSQGYKVTEYNASDARSIRVLRGLISLGMKRLQQEVIVMDEIDGLSERGGVGEIADLIRKSLSPMICIANECPPKLKPIISACTHIKCSRPVKSTIAAAIVAIAKKENIAISKADIEKLCEENGNDIRSILNRLDFYREDLMGNANKDATLRLDLFSATQKLIGNRRTTLDQAADFVYVDYFMVPLMVQEAYVAASKDSLEHIVAASEFISDGDLFQRRLQKSQDWSLLPHIVQTSVAAARTVSGPAPFQIFPQLLGKNSKKMKHMRLLEDMSRSQRLSKKTMRLDCAEWYHRIVLKPLQADKPDIKGTIQRMQAIRLTRDDLLDSMNDMLCSPVEVPTKVKTAFTREYNKSVMPGIKRKRVADSESDSDSSLEDEDIKELDGEMELLNL
jgi:replication factor C subunit 1